jgi:hypothetical protein
MTGATFGSSGLSHIQREVACPSCARTGHWTITHIASILTRADAEAHYCFPVQNGAAAIEHAASPGFLQLSH